MSNFDHYEFYKELYFKENERRQEVENTLNIPLAIVTALVAGIYILATTFSYDVHWIASTIFIALMLITFGFLTFSVYYQCLAFSDIKGIRVFLNLNNSFTYKGIPFARSLFDWHANLETYYQQQNPPPAPGTADNELKAYLITQFVDSVDHNTFVNDKKLALIFKCKICLVAALIFNVLALFPYGYSFVYKKGDIHKVEIQNKSHKIEILNPDKDKETMKKMQRPGASRGSVHPSTANTSVRKSRSGQFKSIGPNKGKPSPPDGRVIKEGKYPDEPPGYKK